MLITDLPENVIKLTKLYNDYAAQIAKKYRQKTRELSKEDLLDPKWYSMEKKDEAIRRIKAMLKASDEMKHDLEEYSISYSKSIFDITEDSEYNITLQTRDKLLKSQQLEVYRFAYLMALNRKLFNDVFDYYAFLDEIREYFLLQNGEIYFERDEDLDEMHRRLYAMVDIQDEMEKIDIHDINTIETRLKELEEHNHSTSIE